MAVHRPPLKCPKCGQILADPVYKEQDPNNPFVGDNFLRYESRPHTCVTKAMFIINEDDLKEMAKIKTTLTVSNTSSDTKYISFDMYKDRQQTCLHEACPECHGTGTKDRGGLCVHFISCPCPKCSITC